MLTVSMRRGRIPHERGLDGSRAAGPPACDAGGMSGDDGVEERDPGESEDPWREESKDSFAANAANEFQYIFQPGEDPDRIEFMGPCPRCAQDPDRCPTRHGRYFHDGTL